MRWIKEHLETLSKFPASAPSRFAIKMVHCVRDGSEECLTSTRAILGMYGKHLPKDDEVQGSRQVLARTIVGNVLGWDDYTAKSSPAVYLQDHTGHAFSSYPSGYHYSSS